jgi:hypothetical protein
MRSIDGYSFADISAEVAVGPLNGGRYAVGISAGNWASGNVTIEKEHNSPGVWLTVHQFTGNSFTVLDMPIGNYRLKTTDATQVYVTIDRIPGE